MKGSMRKRRKGKRECVRKFWRWREEGIDTWDERERGGGRIRQRKRRKKENRGVLERQERIEGERVRKREGEEK